MSAVQIAVPGDIVVSTDLTVTGLNITVPGTLSLNGQPLITGQSTTLGFYGATPVAQHAAIANATDADSAITQLNLVIATLHNLGLIA